MESREQPVEARADTPFSRKAIYHTARRDNAFDDELAAVPAHSFRAERAAAFAAGPPAGSRFIALDLADCLGTPYPATTPSMLARYAVLAANEGLGAASKAGSEIFYVIAGEGSTSRADHILNWRQGDVFCLSGAGETRHRATTDKAILFTCSDEPLQAYLQQSPSGETVAIHYLAEAIAREMGFVYGRGAEEKTWPVQLTTDRLRSIHAATPTMTAGLNPLEPGGVQAPHRHSAGALSLCIQGTGYSNIGGAKIAWEPYGVSLTPPGVPHYHHNTGADYMLNLTIQDAGLHFYLRSMGFTPLGNGEPLLRQE